MNATTSTNLQQAQVALYHSLKAAIGQIAQVSEMPMKDRMKAQGEIAEALLTVLRAQPETPIECASLDSSFQLFKTKLLKKPRKNSKLARDLAV